MSSAPSALNVTVYVGTGIIGVPASIVITPGTFAVSSVTSSSSASDHCLINTSNVTVTSPAAASSLALRVILSASPLAFVFCSYNAVNLVPFHSLTVFVPSSKLVTLTISRFSPTLTFLKLNIFIESQFVSETITSTCSPALTVLLSIVTVAFATGAGVSVSIVITPGTFAVSSVTSSSSASDHCLINTSNVTVTSPAAASSLALRVILSASPLAFVFCSYNAVNLVPFHSLTVFVPSSKLVTLTISRFSPTLTFLKLNIFIESQFVSETITSTCSPALTVLLSIVTVAVPFAKAKEGSIVAIIIIATNKLRSFFIIGPPINKSLLHHQ